MNQAWETMWGGPVPPPDSDDNHRAEYEAEEATAYRQLVSWLSSGNRKDQ
jgi:hypothetical protein